MVKIKQDLAYRKNYGNMRALSQIKFIVIHYTGNDGDTDENNGNYFDDKYIGASAHYFVDDDSATQSVPDNYVAHHCGGKRQSKYGGAFYGECNNTNSIGIEICDDVKNGVIYPSAKTIANVLELTEYLMKKYNVPKSRVIRHYDVTGKMCPAYWCGTATKNNLWLTEFWNKLDGTGVSTVNDKTLEVDGLFGSKTIRRLQEIFGTTVDGIVSNQWASYKSKNPGLTTGWDWDTKPNGKGSELIRALQKWAGMSETDCDGEIGTKTIRALQKKLGCFEDGYISNPSIMVRALQRWANKQP